MELGESPEQTALRELEEKTGLSARNAVLLGVASTYSEQYDTVLVIGFSVEDFYGTLRSGDDTSESAFYYFDELPKIAFDSHAMFIRKYHQNW